MAPLVALLGATALHAGFQLVVTCVVYPALACVPGGESQWPSVHDLHSRRIAPLVGVVYLVGIGAGGWVLVAGPRTGAVLASLAATAVALALTALAAAPLHSRLGRDGPRPALLRRLLLVDRLRLAAALGAVMASSAALL